MAEVVRMPEVMAGVEEAAVQGWTVAAGDTVTAGQAIAEIETEKATVDFEVERAGVVGRILVDSGTNVEVGEPLIVILDAGEPESAVDEALAAIGYGGASAAAPAEAATAPVAAETAAPAEVAPAASAESAAPAAAAPAETGEGRLKMSPITRRLAAEAGVDAWQLSPSGPGGRIVRRDLENYLALNRPEGTAPTALPAGMVAEAPIQPAPATPVAPVATAVAPTAKASAGSSPYVEVPTSKIRQVIARRLTESKSTVPHYYLTATCRVDALLETRAEINAGGGRKVSVNDFVIKAVAGALMDVPEANVIWQGDTIRQFSQADISIAVSTDGGLITPILRDVASKSLSTVSAEAAELIERSRAGGLRQHELEGGSFAISNLGMYGTEEFSAILNPPQSGILAVGAARKAPVVNEKGKLKVGRVMTVTLSADHRVLDGALAAQLLAAIQRRLENPILALS